jgi:hypothetical protein
MIVITRELREIIQQKYLETYSVTKVIQYLRSIGVGLGRVPITNVLKENKIFESYTGKNYIEQKAVRHLQLLQERYGVTNWGQTSNGGFKEANKIPYKKTKLFEDYRTYRLAVERLTIKQVKRMKRLKQIPAYCELTTIRFADEEGPVNPNDPRKRTTDHKIPIIICFLSKMTVQEAADSTNLAFILRMVNSLKSSTLFDSFKPYANAIRERLLDEGFESSCS